MDWNGAGADGAAAAGGGGGGGGAGWVLVDADLAMEGGGGAEGAAAAGGGGGGGAGGATGGALGANPCGGGGGGGGGAGALGAAAEGAMGVRGGGGGTVPGLAEETGADTLRAIDAGFGLTGGFGGGGLEWGGLPASGALCMAAGLVVVVVVDVDVVCFLACVFDALPAQRILCSNMAVGRQK